MTVASSLPDLSAGARSRGLIVVPTYNELKSIGRLVARFFEESLDLDLLVVDDDSPDGTAARCRELRELFPRLQLIVRHGERGLGRAYVAGMKFGLSAGYELIGTMDADLSHDPEALREMTRRVTEADVVIGSRYIRDGGTVNWRLRRILLSWLANRFAAMLLGVNAHDMTSGFRLYRSSSLHRIDLDAITSTGYSFLVEMLYLLARSGARVVEVPIIFTDRTLGKSKLGSREIYVGASHLLMMRFSQRRRLARDSGRELAGASRYVPGSLGAQGELGTAAGQERSLEAEQSVGKPAREPR